MFSNESEAFPPYALQGPLGGSLSKDALFGGPAFTPDIVMILRQRYTYGQFENCTKEHTQRIVDHIFEEMNAIGDISFTRTTNFIMEVNPDLDVASAERIARTELGVLMKIASDLDWAKDDPTGTRYKYKMLGPSDNRTCDAHLILEQWQGEGKSKPELIAMIDELRRRYFPKMEPRSPFFLHPNERHRPVRHIRSGEYGDWG